MVFGSDHLLCCMNEVDTLFDCYYSYLALECFEKGRQILFFLVFFDSFFLSSYTFCHHIISKTAIRKAYYFYSNDSLNILPFCYLKLVKTNFKIIVYKIRVIEKIV